VRRWLISNEAGKRLPETSALPSSTAAFEWLPRGQAGFHVDGFSPRAMREGSAPSRADVAMGTAPRRYLRSGAIPD